MTVLHVGCMPFPTYQGTQAALAAMLDASAEYFGDTHLVTYAGRAYQPTGPRYTVHRIADHPRVDSLRSGPSWGKVALDLRMVAEIRKVASKVLPRAVLAHHIEAAAAALAAGVPNLYYVAHTALEPELPTYFPPVVRGPVAFAGRSLERVVCSHVRGVAAVAPELATTIGDRCRYLPVPWPCQQGREGAPRRAREAIGVAPDVAVGLYAGNLDRYQGWEGLIDALGHLRRTHSNAMLVIATQSEPRPILDAARRAGLSGAVRVVPIDGEAARERAHRAADFAWVPRRTPGGLPIKLLDALSRGLPVVATRRASAGLALDRACVLVRDDDPEALAHGARSLLDDRDRADRQTAAAHQYLAHHHSVEAFGHAAAGLMRAQRQPATRAQPPAPVAAARRSP